MLPTNSGHAKDKGCSPVSSNCVVWQGPDLDCIGLCKGDTISDVVAKLAEELCTLIELFDLGEYDFTCLAIPTSEDPSDFQDLIQILIDRVCALEGITPVTATTAADCPDDCIVAIASCFYFTNPQGDTVTTMTLADYVTAIGNQICSILDSITLLESEVATLQSEQTATQSQVDSQEISKADVSSLQYQVSQKTSPSAPTDYITDSLRLIENSLISTQDALGTASEQYLALLKEGNIGTQPKLFGVGAMNTIQGWDDDVTKTADSIGNLWLSIADIRSAVSYMQENCCSTGCSDLFLNFRAELDVQITTTFLTIFTDGSTGFTDDWKECQNDTRVTVTDALGNSTTFRTSLIALIDTPSGFQVDLTPTSIDPTQNIVVTADTCFTNTSTETTCEKVYADSIIQSPDCPAVVLTIFATAVSYQFTASAGFSYIINVYLDGGSTPVAQQVVAQPGAIVANSIFGLLTETDYELEVVIVDTSGTETPCTKQPFTTLPDNCVPPTGTSAMLTTP